MFSIIVSTQFSSLVTIFSGYFSLSFSIKRFLYLFSYTCGATNPRIIYQLFQRIVINHWLYFKLSKQNTILTKKNYLILIVYFPRDTSVKLQCFFFIFFNNPFVLKINNLVIQILFDHHKFDQQKRKNEENKNMYKLSRSFNRS